ncbi:DsbE family thiol:disulfide interchange protein [Larsenimonas rhizosphaerae]|uniref:DsbE family thiol:disulfide interchange protein n=1 Tax=Larsenimonas rhizosphaerae TaxID=2944682 RepID=A0AA41ZEK4_9GAMM|nr:DsbE family thiol:disulfide interchange protein [Larsenimonas rhizosphaerae]MCM2130005.1 DsbE family thiol:disulfide interchange protein [Larsenimonas rhizosphaerae]MCX2522704.1 DsbE family thiol:disulfide interchange protein [Larsenimonas rhizosphaerae]
MQRRWLLFIPLVLFIALGVFLWKGLDLNPFARDSALIDQGMPEFSLTALDDPTVNVDRSALLGHVTLVNVWGSWCPTCKDEMPQLLALHHKGVRIMGVDYKDTRVKARDFLNQFGNPFDVSVFDPDGTLGFDLGVYGAPESFIVDARGVIRYHHTGYIRPEDIQDTILPEIKKWSSS